MAARFGVSIVRRPATQPGLVTVRAATPAELRTWDTTLDRMVRARQLVVLDSRADPDIAGRRHEILAQYHEGIPLYGGSISREPRWRRAVATTTTAQGVAVSIIGTIATNMDGRIRQWSTPTCMPGGTRTISSSSTTGPASTIRQHDPLTAAVHTGLVNNAFFVPPPFGADGRSMFVFGRTTGGVPLTTLDIVAYEMMHGVTDAALRQRTGSGPLDALFIDRLGPPSFNSAGSSLAKNLRCTRRCRQSHRSGGGCRSWRSALSREARDGQSSRGRTRTHLMPRPSAPRRRCTIQFSRATVGLDVGQHDAASVYTTRLMFPIVSGVAAVLIVIVPKDRLDSRARGTEIGAVEFEAGDHLTERRRDIQPVRAMG